MSKLNSAGSLDVGRALDSGRVTSLPSADKINPCGYFALYPVKPELHR